MFPYLFKKALQKFANLLRSIRRQLSQAKLFLVVLFWSVAIWLLKGALLATAKAQVALTSIRSFRNELKFGRGILHA